MNRGHDVRWHQRFENFARALALLEDALQHGPARLNQLEKAIHGRYLAAMQQLHRLLAGRRDG